MESPPSHTPPDLLLSSSQPRESPREQTREEWLACAKVFRESLQVQGEALSTTVINARQEE